MGWKSVRKGTNVNEALPFPEKNRGQTAKWTSKSVEQEENHKKRPTLVVGKKPNGKYQLIRFNQAARQIPMTVHGAAQPK
jgi:hypothetical protein